MDPSYVTEVSGQSIQHCAVPLGSRVQQKGRPPHARPVPPGAERSLPLLSEWLAAHARRRLLYVLCGPDERVTAGRLHVLLREMGTKPDEAEGQRDARGHVVSSLRTGSLSPDVGSIEEASGCGLRPKEHGGGCTLPEATPFPAGTNPGKQAPDLDDTGHSVTVRSPSFPPA